MQVAALKAQDRWAAWGLAEHGRSITCEFRGEDQVPPGEWPSRGRVHFEYSTAEGVSVKVSCGAHNVAARGVPAPAHLIKAWREEEGHRAAERATRTTGCPCRFLRSVAPDTAASAVPAASSESVVEITSDTTLEFEWMHVQTQAGQPHIVRISFLDMKVHGRDVPQCPHAFTGRPWLLV